MEVKLVKFEFSGEMTREQADELLVTICVRASELGFDIGGGFEWPREVEVEDGQP